MNTKNEQNSFLYIFEIGLLYFLGILQGISFVTVPASSNILTNPIYQNLNPNEYGSLFIPMIIAAIVISSLGGAIGKKRGMRLLLLSGILFNAIAMICYSASSRYLEFHFLTYLSLLFTLFFLGAGFGAILTSLNILVPKQFPNKSATALTALHAFLGIGTAIGPIFLSFALSIGKWWLSPFITGILFAITFFLILFFSDIGKKTFTSKMSTSARKERFPPYLALFLLITFLYGICETVIGNWSPIYLKQIKGLSTVAANESLASFWFCVTLGRILISLFTNWISFRWFHLGLPCFVTLLIFLPPEIQNSSSNMIIFGLIGFACSAILPLNINFGEQAFPNYKEIASGMLMSAYMAGYGVGSYGSGGLQAVGVVNLKEIFWIAGIAAILMAALSIVVAIVFHHRIYKQMV